MKYLPTKTLYLLASILLPLYAQAGWGDALLKQVVKDVATETVKQEATKAIVNQFNKADPNYEGPKTASQAESESAALSVSAITVETEALNPTKDFSNTKLIKNVKKRTNRVVVGGFRVAFILSNVASASEDNGLLNMGNSAGSGMKTIHQDRTVKMEKILYGIDEADMQAITDQAYNDFVQKLQASGLEVLPASTFLNSPQFAEIDQTPAPYKKDSGWFRPNDIHVYSPTTLPLWFGHFDANGYGDKGALSLGNWKKVNKFSGDNNVIVLIPQLTINFADMQSSGRRSMFKKASVKAEDIIHFTSNNTCMLAFYSKAGAPSGDLGATALEDNYHVPGKFAVNYLVDETDNATWVNSMTRLTGTSGNIHSSETWAVVANKNVFKQYTAAGGGVINSAFIELLKQ
ncbi:MAG: hypothetical protein ACSHX4_13205 [Opitutaceae bacterium]